VALIAIWSIVDVASNIMLSVAGIHLTLRVACATVTCQRSGRVIGRAGVAIGAVVPQT